MVIQVFAGENRPLLSPLLFMFLFSGIGFFVFIIMCVTFLADCHPSLKLFWLHFKTSFIHFINLSFYNQYSIALSKSQLANCINFGKRRGLVLFFFIVRDTKSVQYFSCAQSVVTTNHFSARCNQLFP